MKKKLFLFLILFLNAALIILQVFISHNVASLSTDLKKMQTDIDLISMENELLKSEIATASSLTAIARKADLSGFKRAVSLYLDNLPVALSK